MAQKKPAPKRDNKQGKKSNISFKNQPQKNLPVKNNYPVLALLAVIAVTFISYISAIYNEMTNWDDNRYVYDNPLVKSLSFSNIAHLFNFNTYVGGNYHPLAILSLAIDYALYGVHTTPTPGWEGTGYHVTSILIHLCSVAVLYIFCLRLTKQVWVAAITALLFGIHPMHVESVAWVSERKDQLYVLFYFAALYFYVKYNEVQKDEKTVSLPVIIISLLLPCLIVIAYLKFIAYFYLVSAIIFFLSIVLIIGARSSKKAMMYYLLVIACFILSLLSKGQAVTLPVVLLLIDFYMFRKTNKNELIEKIPFFILSAFFGIIAVLAQKTSHSIQDIKIFPYLDRIMFACYALVGYLYKMILPMNLSAFYPYPQKADGHYPMMIYISPFIILILLGLFALTARKRLVVFGTGFFLVNIVLLLQLLPVGSAIMSDRYSYLAYTGLFFIIAVLINVFIKDPSNKGLKPFLLIGLSGYMIFLVITTYERNQVWQNSETLWADVIVKEPRCGLAYNQLGSVHQKQDKIDIAFRNFNDAIGLQPDYPEAYVNRSDIFRVRGKMDSAIRDCDTALKYRHNYPEAYINRGIARANKGEIDSAMSDFLHAVHIDNNLPNVYVNIGNVYDMRGLPDSAIANYGRAIKYDPNQYSAYEDRGMIYRKKGNLDAALTDLNTSIQMDPKHAMESYYQRSLLYNQKGNKTQALMDATMAKTLGKPIDEAYINSLKGQ